MDNKFCPTCGNKLEANKRFCEKCGEKIEIEEKVVEEKTEEINEVENEVVDETTQVVENEVVDEIPQVVETTVVDNSQQIIPNNDDKGTMLGIISLLLFYAAPLFVSIISSVVPKSIANFFDATGILCVIVGVLIMIVGVVKYPKNKVMIANMWLIIGTVVAYILLIVNIIIWVLTGQFQV